MGDLPFGFSSETTPEDPSGAMAQGRTIPDRAPIRWARSASVENSNMADLPGQIFTAGEDVRRRRHRDGRGQNLRTGQLRLGPSAGRVELDGFSRRPGGTKAPAI